MTDTGDRDPDYRMSLAAERTYLAYTRTSMTMFAAGVAVVTVIPGTTGLGLRRVVGVILVAMGLVLSVGARLRWRQVDSAMRRGQPLPPSRLASVLVVGMLLAGLLALALVLI